MRSIILFTFAGILLFTTCKKDDNPDTSATQKDGKITFYTNTTNGGNIVIKLNDMNIGTLTTAWAGASAPTCGEANTLTIDANTGVHNYHASDGNNHIWTGSIIINKGDCKVKLLSR